MSHVAWHFFVLEGFPGIGTITDGTHAAMGYRAAVGLIISGEVITLHGALRAFAFAHGSHVNEVAFFNELRKHKRAFLDAGNRSERELEHMIEARRAGFL